MYVFLGSGRKENGRAVSKPMSYPGPLDRFPISLQRLALHCHRLSGTLVSDARGEGTKSRDRVAPSPGPSQPGLRLLLFPRRAPIPGKYGRLSPVPAGMTPLYVAPGGREPSCDTFCQERRSSRAAGIRTKLSRFLKEPQAACDATTAVPGLSGLIPLPR